MPFVEGQGRGVVDGSLEHHPFATAFGEASLGGVQEFRTHSEAPRVGQNVDRDDVSDSPASDFGDDETENRFSCFRFRHQREGTAMANVKLQLRLGIGDTRWKTFLVDFPQGVEILVAKVAQLKSHPDIVAAELERFRTCT